MGDNSKIEWTHMTWNPVAGCTKVGPGCDNCYAERLAERWRGTPGHPYEHGFDLRLWPERLEQPLRMKRPRLIFVNSMSDLFHKGIPDEYIDRVFDVMEKANHHVFQVLTKRSSRMRSYCQHRYSHPQWGHRSPRLVPNHIWLGVSIEDSQRLSRLHHLKRIESTRLFVSFEPLLGKIKNADLRGVAWAIVGGESGPGFRPMEESWALRLRDICKRDEVAFFFKQWGGLRPKSNGRLLDGREWNEMPPVPEGMKP